MLRSLILDLLMLGLGYCILDHVDWILELGLDPRILDL